MYGRVGDYTIDYYIYLAYLSLKARCKVTTFPRIKTTISDLINVN